MQKNHNRLVIILLSCIAIISYANDSVVSNNTSENTQINQVIEPSIPLDKNQISKEVQKNIAGANLGYKILRNCASFDNVRNMTDLKQCMQIAMMGTLPFAMAGRYPDGDNGALYGDWRSNYFSIEEKKKIHSISAEKLDKVLKTYNKCVLNIVSENTFYDVEVLRSELKQKCTIKDNQILK